MAIAEPLANRLRYEAPSYIEEYAAEIIYPDYNLYHGRLDIGIQISMYYQPKPATSQKRKSLRRLPPRVYFGKIPVTEQDLEWKLKFGPFRLTKDMPLAPVIEDISKELLLHRHHIRDGALEAILTPIFCSMKEQYPLINTTWECPD